MLVVMEYKVTALHDVTIRAFVRHKTPERLGSVIVMRPSEREEWISLRAGDVRDGLGMVIGAHPSSVPGETPVHIHGVAMVFIESWSDKELPKEFWGLFRLEVHGKGAGSGGVG